MSTGEPDRGDAGGERAARRQRWVPHVVADGYSPVDARLAGAVWAERARALLARWRRWRATAERESRPDAAAALAQCGADLEAALKEAGENVVLLDAFRDAVIQDVRQVIRSELEE